MLVEKEEKVLDDLNRLPLSSIAFLERLNSLIDYSADILSPNLAWVLSLGSPVHWEIREVVSILPRRLTERRQKRLKDSDEWLFRDPGSRGTRKLFRS